MAGRLGAKTLPSTLTGVTLVMLGACAQSSAPASSDPAYNGLTPRAEVLARNTVQEALETARSRTSLSWTYVEDGSKGEIMPLRTYRSTTGYYCREYMEIVYVSPDGKTSRQRTACRDIDGLWKPIGA